MVGGIQNVSDLFMLARNFRPELFDINEVFAGFGKICLAMPFSMGVDALRGCMLAAVGTVSRGEDSGPKIEAIKGVVRIKKVLKFESDPSGGPLNLADVCLQIKAFLGLLKSYWLKQVEDLKAKKKENGAAKIASRNRLLE